MIGLLMDDDDASGRNAPLNRTRLSLVFGGLYERFVAPETATMHSRIVLCVGAIFAIWYEFVIAWSPGISRAGSVGPFINPMVIVAAIILSALACALLKRARTARLLALVATGSAITMGFLATSEGWYGPSWPLVTIVSGFGLLAALPLAGWANVARAAAAFVSLIVGTVAAQTYLLSGRATREPPIVAAAAAVSVVCLFGVMAIIWPTFRPDRRRTETDAH